MGENRGMGGGLPISGISAPSAMNFIAMLGMSLNGGNMGPIVYRTTTGTSFSVWDY